MPLLWRNLFLTIANDRVYIISYYNRPLNKLDRDLREWYLNENLDDNEIQSFDDNLKKFYITVG